MSTIGNIFNIQRFSVHDGPGIRTTVFMQGCSLSCWWCHNPESCSFQPATSQGFNSSSAFDADELVSELLKDQPFFDESGGGVSFSGGEPLAQADFLSQVLKRCKEVGLHTVVDTTGYASQKQLEEILPQTNLFLYDLKLMDNKQHLKYTGVSNKEIVKNLKFLLQNKAKVWIRIPIIPGITDTKTNLGQIATLLKNYNFEQQINLLPYHEIAEAKYDRLQIPFRMKETKTSDNNHMKIIADYFESYGFSVKIGG